MEQIRDCIVRFESGNEKGKFHRWADVKDLDDANQPYTHTVALVELEDGKIVEVPPSQLRIRPSE